jgi:hypothetical protein
MKEKSTVDKGIRSNNKYAIKHTEQGKTTTAKVHSMFY